MRKAHPGLEEKELSVLRSGLRIVALRSLGDLEAAEEAAQETLVRGLEAISEGRLDHPENPGAYFRGILRHVVADTLKAQKRTVSLEKLPETPDLSPSSDVLQCLISEERKAAVGRVMAKLSPRARECLRLSFFLGLPAREVAIRLGEPATRIRKRRSRALKKVRLMLQEEGDWTLGHESSSGDTREARQAAPGKWRGDQTEGREAEEVEAEEAELGRRRSGGQRT